MMEKYRITVTVNGDAQQHEVEPRLSLVDFLREVVGLTGAHEGCDSATCGACTVLLDGAGVKACTVLAVQADGHCVDTVEGLAAGGALHPIQTAFLECHAVQCGFCTPGMVMAVRDLLSRIPHPSRTEICRGLHGILCRCTGYDGVIKAVEKASALMNAPTSEQ